MVLYALLGVSGLAVLLLGLVVVILLTRGNGGGGQQNTPIASALPTSQPAETTSAGAASQPRNNAITPTNAVVSLVEPTSNPATPPVSIAAPVPAPSPSIASPSLPPDPQEILRRLKDATVYIKNRIAGKTISSGSGFVIEVDGDRVMVATNRHVAVPDLSELPPGLVPAGIAPTIEAVFRSGLGKEEQTFPAQIIAADLSDEMNTDLAFLVVKGVNQPPKPIDPMAQIQPSEGMTYIGAGFPLGGMLGKVTENKGNPSVTITGGRIAALRRDSHGQVSVLQVDGSLQPGNSGGPIIDEKTGKLLGVAVAKVGSVDTIGFVVLAEEVRRALAGRFGSFDLTLEPSSQQGTASLKVKAMLVDPHMQVGGVVVHADTRLDRGKGQPQQRRRLVPSAEHETVRASARRSLAIGVRQSPDHTQRDRFELAQDSHPGRSSRPARPAVLLQAAGSAPPGPTRPDPGRRGPGASHQVYRAQEHQHARPPDRPIQGLPPRQGYR